jgi:pimeloyl-ACP methyl ester carboxylesterase
MQCVGTGQPLLVFDSGLGATSLAFAPVLAPVGIITQACAFDRAGYPWSDPLPIAGPPRTSGQMVEEQRALLRAANLPPPYVLAGLSFGAINTLVYALTYPDEVAGVVLIEPTVPDMFARVPDLPSPRRTVQMLHVLETLARWGLLRPFGGLLAAATLQGAGAALPADARAAWGYFSARGPLYTAMLAEAEGLPESVRQAIAPAGTLGDRPLVVLTGAKQVRPSRLMRPATVQALLREREALARLSTRGEHRTIEGSGHLMTFDAPTAVVQAVQEVVDQVRTGHGGEGQPALGV